MHSNHLAEKTGCPPHEGEKHSIYRESKTEWTYHTKEVLAFQGKAIPLSHDLIPFSSWDKSEMTAFNTSLQRASRSNVRNGI